MTEEEAKTKWCPHVIASHTNPRAVRGYDDDDGTVGTPFHNCIASACMAWRLKFKEADLEGFYQDAPKGSGFCGLAGSPQ